MNRLAYRSSLVALAAVLMATSMACGGVTRDDNNTPDAAAQADAAPTIDAPTAFFSVTGTLSAMVPDDSVAVVVWSNTAGADSIHKFGQGSTSGLTFTVTFDSEPPPAALNSGELGVGVVLVYPAGTVIDDGEITDQTILDGAIAGSPDHAIIFRHSGDLGTPWEGRFQTESFDCGVCVPQMMGFDEFNPVDCSAVEADVGSIDDLAFCNWT